VENDDVENNEQTQHADDETPKLPASQATARFYFQLTYSLAGKDITKFQQIDNSSLYLCLNTAALMKDELIKEKESLKKLEREYKR